jgi:hypothetical protein
MYAPSATMLGTWRYCRQFSGQNKYTIQSRYTNLNEMDLDFLKVIQKSSPNVLLSFVWTFRSDIKNWQIWPFEAGISVLRQRCGFLTYLPSCFVHLIFSYIVLYIVQTGWSLVIIWAYCQYIWCFNDRDIFQCMKVYEKLC